MDLSVLFSFYNEEDVLEKLINRVEAALAPLNIEYEMIFINDTSTDSSLDILKHKSETNSRIKVLNTSRRFGVGPCLRAGFEYSTGDAVVYLDADLQDPPELIPEMYAKFKAGADVVNMTRTERQGESKFKMWVTRKAYQIINLLSDIDLPEDTGDFKMLSRRVVDEMTQLPEHDAFMRGLTRWVGYRQETIFYRREPRAAGNTHFPLLSKGPVNEFRRGILSFSATPLYLALYLGLAVSLSAFCYLGVVLMCKVLDWNLPGWTAIMATMLFLGGTILFTNGIMGLYIAQIYSNVKGRPSYIIESSIGIPLKKHSDS